MRNDGVAREVEHESSVASCPVSRSQSLILVRNIVRLKSQLCVITRQQPVVIHWRHVVLCRAILKCFFGQGHREGRCAVGQMCWRCTAEEAGSGGLPSVEITDFVPIWFVGAQFAREMSGCGWAGRWRCMLSDLLCDSAVVSSCTNK